MIYNILLYIWEMLCLVWIYEWLVHYIFINLVFHIVENATNTYYLPSFYIPVLAGIHANPLGGSSSCEVQYIFGGFEERALDLAKRS